MAKNKISFFKLIFLLLNICVIIDSIVLIVNSVKNKTENANEEFKFALLVTTLSIRIVLSLIVSYAAIRKNDFLCLLHSISMLVIIFIFPFLMEFNQRVLSLILQIVTTIFSWKIVSEMIYNKYAKNHLSEPEKRSPLKLIKILNTLNDNSLALSTCFSVIISIILAMILRNTSDQWTDRQIKYLGFIGEIFLRMLKCLIIPLIVSSLIFALGSIDIRLAGRIGFRTVVYYMSTTIFAIILGIILVVTIRPGESAKDISAKENPLNETIIPIPTEDTILDLIRYLNLILNNFCSFFFLFFKEICFQKI